MLCCGVYHYSRCFYHHRLTFDPPCSASPGMSPPAAAPASMLMTSTATLAATDSRRRARVLCDYDASDQTELSLMADEVKLMCNFADDFVLFYLFFSQACFCFIWPVWLIEYANYFCGVSMDYIFKNLLWIPDFMKLNIFHFPWRNHFSPFQPNSKYIVFFVGSILFLLGTFPA